MPGKTRLDRNFSGFEITDLADHHNVRILAQDRPQSSRECHLHLGVDLRLPDAIDEIFNRVFNCHYVAAVIIDARKRCIQSRGLARAGRSCHQNNAVRFVNQIIHQRLGLIVHAE